MAIKRTSHSVYDCMYHLVWCPKYRHDVFKDEEVRERAGQLMRAVADEYRYEICELQIADEHVHIMLSFPPSVSIGQAVRSLKSITARELFREFPHLRRRMWSGELWEDGYFARTVGDRMTSEVIVRYIRNHREIEQGPEQLEIKFT